MMFWDVVRNPLRTVKNWSPTFLKSTYKLGIFFLDLKLRRSDTYFRLHICYIWQNFNAQVIESEMVKGLKDTNLPEPWFGKKSKALAEQNRTKPMSREMPAQQALEAETGAGLEHRNGSLKG